ncbi:MAG: YkgJ family cysteine cluster protein [Thermodesulfobacteriota bacterium]|jgi:Fe-S-cluster containining protein
MLTSDQQVVLLHAIYNAFDRWSSRFPFACQKGCATCCTQSVTMTSLEGEMIRTYLVEQGRGAEFAGPAFVSTPSQNARLTTNGFVAAHLRGEDVEEPAGWDLHPCPFLAEDTCTIYPARPFGCRLFASLASCAQTGAAEMPPGYLAASTIMLQLIEHLDQNGRWGTLVEILNGLAGEGRAEVFGEPTAPVPGFLIAPDERAAIEPLLYALFDQEINGHTFEQWLHKARL